MAAGLRSYSLSSVELSGAIADASCPIPDSGEGGLPVIGALRSREESHTRDIASSVSLTLSSLSLASR